MTLKITYLNGKVQTIEEVRSIKQPKISSSSNYYRDDTVVVTYGHECFETIEKKHVTKMEVEL